ncbi:rod shape-determining protein MreD [uncultured Desulfuromonas sp.]|uniref:rod shape-determining protein MreD n=1 Tax=uncultured Desulfuromonas sp. TaxID=181013 RepID=UPI002AAB860C|nr:rod shape-determining protein MreD [uncultured Desulfuromonas sp.]
MSRMVRHLTCGLLFILLQTSLFPALVGNGPRPDLVLILTLYLGIHASPLQGAFTSWLLGCLLDVFSGTTFGLYGLILLLVFCATYLGGRQLNRDNAAVMFFAAVLGTAAHDVLLITTLLFFADADQGWRIVLFQLPMQLLLNILAVLVATPFLSRTRPAKTPSLLRHSG